MGRGKLTAAFILAPLLVLASLTAAGAQGQAPSLARSWFEEARLLATAGDWEGARVLLTEGIGLDPSDSDSLYLQALSSFRTERPGIDVLAQLDASLASGRFSYYREDDARLLKAELLVRSRRWLEALSSLGSVRTGAASELAWIRSRALLGLGDRQGFETQVTAALRRFPDETRFARLFLERGTKGIPSEAARLIGASILARLQRYAETDPEMRVLAAALMPSPDARRDAVLAYRSMGGKSAAASLRALEYGIIDAATAGAELFSHSYPILVRDLTEAWSLAGSEAGRSAIAAALRSYDGEVGADRDGDGVVEERIVLEKGRPVEWRRDQGQDGSLRVLVSFAAGLPVSFELDRGEGALKGNYSNWPACSDLSFSDPGPSAGSRAGTSQGLTRTYLFSPEGFAYSPVLVPGGASPGDPALLPEPGSDEPPLERAAASQAIAVRERRGGAEEETITRLVGGVPVSMDSYRQGRLFASLSYEKGRPTTERVDADGDGVFETERIYEWDGSGYSVAWVRMDTNGDGRFDYREQTRFPFRKEWDFGGRGGVDAVQFQLPDGAIRREFSSRLDGDFDEVLIVSSGRLVSLMRDGKTPALVPDANPGLRWIGAKPFDIGSNLPTGEGVFSRMGIRFRIVKAGEESFAEVIP